MLGSCLCVSLEGAAMADAYKLFDLSAGVDNRTVFVIEPL
jgi:hypothetical protein